MSDPASQGNLLDWMDLYRFKGNSWSEWQKFVDRKCYAGFPVSEKNEEECSSSRCAEFDPKDIEIYGKRPEFGEFELVVCYLCVNKYKPAALPSHIRNRHESQQGFPSVETKPDVKTDVELVREIENRSVIDIPKPQFAKHEEPVDKSVNSGPAKRRKIQPITGFFRPTKSETFLNDPAETKNYKSISKPPADCARPSLPVSISNTTILSQLQINGPINTPPSEDSRVDIPSVIKRIKVLFPKKKIMESLAKENTHLQALNGFIRMKEANIQFAEIPNREIIQLHPGYRRCKGLLTTAIYSP